MDNQYVTKTIKISEIDISILKDCDLKKDLGVFMTYKDLIKDTVVTIFKGERYLGAVAKHANAGFTLTKGVGLRDLHESKLSELLLCAAVAWY